MPEWTDNGIIIDCRPHGEDAAIVQVLTKDHGRYAGLVRGGQSRAMRPVAQPVHMHRTTVTERLTAWRQVALPAQEARTLMYAHLTTLD